jgi:gluconolactonase
MTTRIHVSALIAATLLVIPTVGKAQEEGTVTQVIDLRTAAGAAAVNATWRVGDVKLVEVEFKYRDGSTSKGLDIEPRAMAPDFDDSKWEQIEPTGTTKGRGAGKICFVWYRLRVTMPDDVAGKTVTFVTTVDDYGEVWVDGMMPYKEGQSGGTIIAGFNAPNRVVLPDPKPGKTYLIAIFGINGPISVAPTNRIFLREARLEFKAP